MVIFETNYGNFGNFEDIYKFMTYEGKETITLGKASYCCSTFCTMPIECTKEDIRKYCDEEKIKHLI